MKTLRLLTVVWLLLFFNHTTHAQWVSIPDTNFGKWLNTNGYGQCLQGNSTTGWQMDTTCGAVVSAVDMDCSTQNIYDVTCLQFFRSLQKLDCSNNRLAFISSLPGGLRELDCSYQYNIAFRTQFIAATLPGTLQVLSCRSNFLNSLPVLPTGLRKLDCSDNALTVLPALPASLLDLNCGLNNLTGLPALPNSLRILRCYQNYSLFVLPALNDSLEQIYCSHSNLYGIPPLPASLIALYCDLNLLKELPALPGKLEMLECSMNNLDSLPALPASLISLGCSRNPLTWLPALPDSLTDLACSNTAITLLPDLPDNLVFLDVSYTPLSCLPFLKHIQNLSFDSTNITCVQNYPLNIASTPPITSLPLCSFFGSNACTPWNIAGLTYTDIDSNCIYAPGADSIQKNLKIELWQSGSLKQQVISTDGFFAFDAHGNTAYEVRVKTIGTPLQPKCPASGSITTLVTLPDTIDADVNFSIECKPGFDLEARSVSTTQVFRPANFTTVDVSAGDASNFYNAHCAAGTAGNVILSYTGPVKYISPANGALTPTSVSNNTLTWSIADFGNVNFFEDFDVIMQTDTSAQIGQQVCFTLTASPVVNDNNPANNTFSICFPVVNSYDPNDKQAYPAGNIDTLQEDLVYTVRFQNTGNAEAQHIYITDTLDANVRPETFELLAYSHQPMVQIDGRAVRFNFPNINLPDSFSNEPGSHGYVQYRVKLKENLPVGTVINNTAFIYFDFNAPVITNTTTNTVSVEVDTIVGIRNIKPTAEVFVYPNPANKAVTITVSESMSNATVTVTDLLGRKAVEPVWLNNTRSIRLNTQNLSEGVYIVNVASKEGTTLTRRLVIND